MDKYNRFVLPAGYRQRALSDEQVHQIRRFDYSRSVTLAAVMVAFDISATTIRRITRGQTYRESLDDVVSTRLVDDPRQLPPNTASRYEAIWNLSEETASGCWEYVGDGPFKDGYPIYHSAPLHHLAFVLSGKYQRSDPNMTVIQHDCDNRRCFNPDHLLGGNQDGNMWQRAMRQRHGRPLIERSVLIDAYNRFIRGEDSIVSLAQEIGLAPAKLGMGIQALRIVFNDAPIDVSAGGKPEQMFL